MKMRILVNLFVVRREVQFLQVHFLIQMAWLRMGFHWGQM